MNYHLSTVLNLLQYFILFVQIYSHQEIVHILCVILYLSRSFNIKQIYRLKMKNVFFEEKEFNQQEFNPLEILNAFQQLKKSIKTVHVPPNNKASDIVQPVMPLIENKQADQISNSSKGLMDLMPKKTYIIKKQTVKQPKQQQAQQHNQNSIGRISNFSKSQDIFEDNAIAFRKVSVTENNNNKTKSIFFSDKQFSNLKLSEEIKELETKYKKKQQLFMSQKNQLIENCDRVLKQSFKKKLQFTKFLSFQNDLKDLIYQKQMSHKYQSQMQYLNEQNKTKTKRGKKNQIEDQQNKSAQLIARKSYISFLNNKMLKEKQKYTTNKYSQYQLALSQLSLARIQQLKKNQYLKSYSWLCLIQGTVQHIEEILCMDMNKLQECTISCLKYSPILPKHKRTQVFQSFKKINILAKKLISPSPNIFFPNKVNFFIPISNILSTQDEIFVINQKNEQYNSLSKFLNRIDFSPTQQGFGVLKYLLTMCFKILQQLQNTKFSSVIIPKFIFINQKFQVKFKNLIFNQLIYHHFRHLFHDQDRYFFPPQENAQPQAATLWSIGMLAYFLYFNSKPFTKYNPYSWPSRQYFFVVNQIQYPSKLPASQKIRQLIYTCMTANNNTKDVLEGYSDFLNNLHGK